MHVPISPGQISVDVIEAFPIFSISFNQEKIVRSQVYLTNQNGDDVWDEDQQCEQWGSPASLVLAVPIEQVNGKE